MEAKQALKHAKGTTTLAFIFNEGVIVAADSRASMGGYICKYLSPISVLLHLNVDML
jgi:20S proteasome alpha/beta subunit